MLQEEAMLTKRQEEIKKKLNLLNSGQIPAPAPSQLPRKGPPSVAPSIRSDATGSESEDDNVEDGDLGLGLGTVLDPKTGKAT